jgi:signal transduction histidine kinase
MSHGTSPSGSLRENHEAARLRRTVDRLKKTNARLRDMEKFRTDLTHMIIHDLKAPLAEVIANLSLLQEEDLSSSQRDYLDSAVLGAEEIHRRVQNILQIYRLESKKKMIRQALFDPLEAIERVIEGLSTPASMKNVSIHVHGPEDGHLLFADKDLFHRVLLNLVTNAIEHTPGGGEIDVDLVWPPNSEGAQVGVSDTGSGINETDRRRIFQKHFTLRRGETSNHLGLGLAFCKLAVEAHGGKIWVEDTLGSGIRFVFFIPNALGEYPRKRRSGQPHE